MKNLNNVVLEGVFAEDPLFRNTPKSGTPVCTFTLVSEWRSHDERSMPVEEVGCFNIEARGHLAEVIRDKGHAGRGVRLIGRLKEDRWTAVDGTQKSKVSIVVGHIEFRPEKTDL